jgi:hypothetical protein
MYSIDSDPDAADLGLVIDENQVEAAKVKVKEEGTTVVASVKVIPAGQLEIFLCFSSF